MNDVRKFYETFDFGSMLSGPPAAIAECVEQEDGMIRSRSGSFGDTLEVGCGDGRILEMLHGASRIVGIDFSRLALRKARERLRGRAVETYLMRADALRFPDESFDTVLCLNHTMSNMPGIERDVLREMFRVCRLGGRILVSVYSERARSAQVANYARLGLAIRKETGNEVYLEAGLYSRRFTYRELTQLFQSASFSRYEIVSPTPIGYLVTAIR
ncbi:MAG: class I SAM-dependent methyltransferase [Candidatus Moranbacteria bacterium]|nr:class I SAM-dependent methyltransferase [Candidatus Moranbacteria bacterium]